MFLFARLAILTTNGHEAKKGRKAAPEDHVIAELLPRIELKVRDLIFDIHDPRSVLEPL